MKKVSLSYLLGCFLLVAHRTQALNRFQPLQDPYGQPTTNEVIDTSSVNDPLRQGAAKIAEGVWGIKSDGAGTFDEAKSSLLESIQSVLNWVLGFLAMIAVIYLIIQGIQLLLTPKDDEVKKIRTRISSAAWAIGGIGFSRLIVSFLFYIVKIFTNS